ncbi:MULTISPECIES: TRAP transporter substrate-binding protein [unclassified Roseovarius]|uniref:TRAP transporter substrate-binding protein n=1 Tax=unclassified Roseovarius TaxID=2614913 RepID=UPI00273D2EF5|nr:TRAP transporter substrate-binding protein [Roseovarius sp. MMSF_3350]
MNIPKTMAAIIAGTVSLSAITAASAQSTSISLAHGAAPDHPWNLAAQKFAEEVSEQSDGDISVNIFTAGQMGSEREMVEATQSGSIQMSLVSTMAMSGTEPSLQVFDLPYLFPNEETAYEVLDGEIGEEVAAPLLNKGLRNLAYWENDYRQLSNDVRPIESIEDVEGLKIRVPETPILMTWVEELGGVATPIPYTELYGALQQGVVDGQDNGILLMRSANYYEVQDYYTLTRHIYAPVAFLVNENFYQSLSDESRGIIQTAAENARDYQREISREAREQDLATMEEAGLQITELSDEAMQEFQDSASPVYEAMRDVVNQEIVDRIRAIADENAS